MKPFSDYLREDQRLVMLRLLTEMPAYRSNSSVLVAGLGQMGHAVTRDQVKTELSWLSQQGMLNLEDLGSVMVATLTERGADVAKGLAVVPGIKRPGA